jgi:hypothetical protein
MAGAAAAAVVEAIHFNASLQHHFINVFNMYNWES